MMNKNKFGGLWLGMTLISGMLAGGCGAGTATGSSSATTSATTGTSAAAVTQDSTSLVAQAVDTTSDASDAAEVASLMRDLNAPRSDAVEGFHCDAKPVVTTTTVCGKKLPATVHLEWTTCAAPSRPGTGGSGGGAQTPPAEGHGGSGSCTQPPPTDGHGGSGTQTPPEDGHGGNGSGTQTPPEDGHGGSGGKQPPPAGSGSGSGTQTPPPADEHGGGDASEPKPSLGPSTGTVDIAYTYDAAADCSGSITQNQAVTFQISRTDGDGAVSTQQGTTTSSAVLVAAAPPQQKATSVDATRTLTDKAGTVVKSVHLKGSMNVDFSSDTPPVRTINGSYAETFLDGTTGTVTLASIVRPPREVCPWPTSGSLTRVAADNTSHTLAFGPDCGAATLDGTAVDLSAERLPDSGKH